MKTRNLLALAYVFHLLSCQPSDTIQVQAEAKRYPVQFALHLKKEILPFPDTRSMPDITIPDPVAEGSTGSPETALYNRIDYLVYKDDEPVTLVHHKQFKSTDDDFGIIYDSLPAGEYRIAFLAHASETATLSGSQLSFDKVSDTFQTAKSLSVGENKETNNDIELKRIVSRIEFVSEEVVPATIKKLDIEVAPYFNQTDVFTGKGTTQTASFLISHLFTDEEKEKNAPLHSFYTFIPSAGETLSAILTATGTDDRVIESREVKGITAVGNKIVRYKGKLYSPKKQEETFSLSIYGDGSWDEPGEDIPLE